MGNRCSVGAFLAITAGLVIAPAQRTLQFDVAYSCSNGQTRLKVLSCAGNSDADSCDIQYLDRTAAQGLGARISAPRKQVTALLQTCVIERPPAKVENAPAPPAPAPVQQRPPSNNPPPVARPPQQMSSNGIKVGDTVDFNTAFGWVSGRVMGINGNSYRILAPTGGEVWKTYPSEVRRTGPATAEDRAAGIYQLHDKVQVLFEGRWVNSEIVTILGMEYQVTLPGNRIAWANPQQLRPLATAPPSAPAAATTARGEPCGSKLEGRWGATAGIGGASVEFRSGKAHMEAPLIGRETVDCSIIGDKIILTKPGDPEELVWRLNDDGTIEAGIFGELRKKGK